MISEYIRQIDKRDATFFLLLLLLIFLPLFEAPKNWLFVLFVFSCFFIEKSFWMKGWILIDWTFLAWIMITFVVGINAIFVHKMPMNINDTIRFLLFGWCVSRITFFSDKKVIILSIIAILSTVFTLIYTYKNCPGGGGCIELNSVGHVNHTAIFLTIAYALSLSILVFSQKTSQVQKIILLVSSLFLAYGITDSLSRAAFGLMIITTIVILFFKAFFLKQSHLSLLIISTIIVISSIVYNPPKIFHEIENGTSLVAESPRKKIRRFSYYAFLTNPILGVGFDNFSKLGLNDIKDAVIKSKGSMNEQLYMPYSHPHNLYYAYLVGGGIIAFSVFILFWLSVSYMVFYFIKNRKIDWVVMAAMAVIMINLGIGFVNTTLHHEHAILSMFVLGLLISKYRTEFENTD